MLMFFTILLIYWPTDDISGASAWLRLTMVNVNLYVIYIKINVEALHESAIVIIKSRFCWGLCPRLPEIVFFFVMFKNHLLVIIQIELQVQS